MAMSQNHIRYYICVISFFVQRCFQYAAAILRAAETTTTVYVINVSLNYQD